jgi:hypothetical protein
MSADFRTTVKIADIGDPTQRSRKRMLFTFIASSPGGGVGPENRYAHRFSYYFQLITFETRAKILPSTRTWLLVRFANFNGFR